MTEAQETPLQLQLDAEAATLALGAALARSLPRAAPDALVVYLKGDLGSGKTTLARALLHALGVSGTVRSPSYTLVESYELAGLLVLTSICIGCANPASSNSSRCVTSCVPACCCWWNGQSVHPSCCLRLISISSW